MGWMQDLTLSTQIHHEETHVTINYTAALRRGGCSSLAQGECLLEPLRTTSECHERRQGCPQGDQSHRRVIPRGR